MPTNQLRIIGGEWRSRLISFPDIPGLRPTPNRVRETLFNWLQYDIPGSRCLDLYAGSGALGFEAASRGAKEVVQVEQDTNVCKALRENAAKLKASQISSIHADVLHFLTATKPEPFEIVFLDPPFGLNLVSQTCRLLENHNWLSDHALIYIEMESDKKQRDDFPVSWVCKKSKQAGEVSYQLFERHR